MFTCEHLKGMLTMLNIRVKQNKKRNTQIYNRISHYEAEAEPVPSIKFVERDLLHYIS